MRNAGRATRLLAALLAVAALAACGGSDSGELGATETAAAAPARAETPATEAHTHDGEVAVEGAAHDHGGEAATTPDEAPHVHLSDLLLTHEEVAELSVPVVGDRTPPPQLTFCGDKTFHERAAEATGVDFVNADTPPSKLVVVEHLWRFASADEARAVFGEVDATTSSCGQAPPGAELSTLPLDGDRFGYRVRDTSTDREVEMVVALDGDLIALATVVTWEGADRRGLAESIIDIGIAKVRRS